jgi:hypothetical protein
VNLANGWLGTLLPDAWLCHTSLVLHNKTYGHEVSTFRSRMRELPPQPGSDGASSLEPRGAFNLRGNRTRIPSMPMRSPELQMKYDENSIPVSAKCSVCGEEMPQSRPRLLNPMDNVEWFAAQFRLHLERIHLPAGQENSRVQ